MALPIRPNSGAQPGSKPTTVRTSSPKPAAAKEFSLPSLDDLVEPAAPARKRPSKQPAPAARAPKPAPEPAPPVEEELEEGWAIDEKTGVKYKTIPKSVYEGKGKNAIPVLAIEDFDVDDMTGEAETYLGHLRIPPNKEEQEKLKQLRAQMRRNSDASYAEANKDELEKDDEPELEFTAPKAKVKAKESKPSFMQKLTGLFR
jgi:hypothetical protein